MKSITVVVLIVKFLIFSGYTAVHIQAGYVYITDGHTSSTETAVESTTLKTPEKDLNGATTDLETIRTAIAEYLSNNPGAKELLRSVFPVSSEKTYYFGKFFKANFYNADIYCKDRGMKLASIESAQEQKKVEKVLNNVVAAWAAGPIWTSGSRSEVDGAFVWSSTGIPFTYTKWAKGEPQSSDSRNCLAVLKTAEGYRWYIKSCSEEYYFICEYYDQGWCQNGS